MSAAFKIDKDIPAPTGCPGGRGNARFPLAKLEVGESFYVPWGESELKTRSVVSNAVAAFHLRNKPKRFTSRKDDGGIRVWRVA